MINSTRIYATLKSVGKLYTAEGKTVREAVDNLKPEIARGASVLTLEDKKNNKKREKILTPALTFRLFGATGSLNRSVAQKSLETIFGDFKMT